MKRTCAAAVCAALVLCPGWARAQEAAPQEPPPPASSVMPSLPARLGDVPGTWDLSRDGTNRRCVMTLTLDNGEAGRRLHFPAGCRRALPVVNAVAGWLFADEAVRLVDRNIRPVLMFVRRPDRRSYVANAEGGETYSLVPLDIAAMRPPEPQRLESPALRSESPSEPQAVAVPAQPPPAVQPPPDPAPLPGTYALDRFQERDTCRIALDGAVGTVKVVPGCRDSGLEVFDPVRWRYARGRMTLTAKRGHSIELVPTGDGRWRRDPEVGTTFVLRRVEP